MNAPKKFRVAKTLRSVGNNFKLYHAGDEITLTNEAEIKRLLATGEIVLGDARPEIERAVSGPPEKRRGRPKK